MKFCFFHLMPFTGVNGITFEWPTPNRLFDPQRAHELYRTYVDAMAHAEECGFDWVGCNEHHFSPYGLMANCNLIGGALAYRTRRIRIAMMGNLVPLIWHAAHNLEADQPERLSALVQSVLARSEAFVVPYA